MKVEAIIIHHTGNFRDQSDTTYIGIARYHRQKFGISTMGYNYFIDAKDGRIHKGRNFKTERGYHCSADNMNFKSIGICLEGNFEKETPGPKQLENLETLIDNFRRDYGIRIKNILGHCEVKSAATLCPGKNLLKWTLLWRKKHILKKMIEALSAIIKKLRGGEEK